MKIIDGVLSLLDYIQAMKMLVVYSFFVLAVMAAHTQAAALPESEAVPIETVVSIS